MKLVTFKYNNFSDRLGLLENDWVCDLNIVSNGTIPSNIIEFLNNHDRYNEIIKNINLKNNKISINDIIIQSPILKPNSLRDAYAFRQHVEAGRNNRGLKMIPEYDMFPVFYYGNHNTVSGQGIIEIQHENSEKLDYELEIAVIIGKNGKNISVEDADEYIFGYTIMNDFSARKLQIEEMKLNLGPAKGKDFLTTLGPYIVSKDELSNRLIKGENGPKYDMKMHAYLNGNLLSQDNFKNISWTFSQIISRISIGVEIFPGDVIGSGTCSTGCLLELNLTNSSNRWLKDGDEIELKVEGLGNLSNKVKII